MALKSRPEMVVRKIDEGGKDDVSALIAKFRTELKSYKGISSEEDIISAQEEFSEYIASAFPVYACYDNEECVGYIVCRVEEPVVWVESLYVVAEKRRNGVATLLYDEAEALAKSYGEDTLYNYVHPNNDGMIRFLSKRGYDVLNLIEIRKKIGDERLTETISVRNNVFNY
jgi:Acetyltransferases